MIARALGGMQIANDRIVVVERELSDQERAPFVIYRDPALLADSHAKIYKEWVALTGEQVIVGVGVLFEMGDNESVVVLSAYVSPDYRRVGLGRLMLRFGTDQAIRYRKRTILAKTTDNNAAALRILEDEDFEKQADVLPGYAFFKKELKWV